VLYGPVLYGRRALRYVLYGTCSTVRALRYVLYGIRVLRYVLCGTMCPTAWVLRRVVIRYARYVN